MSRTSRLSSARRLVVVGLAAAVPVVSASGARAADLSTAPGSSRAASAAKTHFHAEQAFRKGIRETASTYHAKASKIRISCTEVPKVGDRKPCTGSFELTRAGRTAHYVLTKEANTFRVSRGAIEYEVRSRSAKKVRGLPRKPGLSGFLQT